MATKKKAKAKPKAKAAEKAAEPVEQEEVEVDPEPEAPTQQRAFVHRKRTVIYPLDFGAIHLRNWHIRTSDPKVCGILEKAPDYVEIPVERTQEFVRMMKETVTPNFKRCVQAAGGRL